MTQHLRSQKSRIGSDHGCKIIASWTINNSLCKSKYISSFFLICVRGRERFPVSKLTCVFVNVRESVTCAKKNRWQTFSHVHMHGIDQKVRHYTRSDSNICFFFFLFFNATLINVRTFHGSQTPCAFQAPLNIL